MDNPTDKYSAFQPISLQNRKWPEKVLKEGWLHTGDIGELDENNYLKITDRKKDIIVNLGGDNISPSKVENILCLNENIKQSFVYGDKKNYLVALIVSEKQISKEKIKNIDDTNEKNLGSFNVYLKSKNKFR